MHMHYLETLKRVRASSNSLLHQDRSFLLLVMRKSRFDIRYIAMHGNVLRMRSTRKSYEKIYDFVVPSWIFIIESRGFMCAHEYAENRWSIFVCQVSTTSKRDRIIQDKRNNYYDIYLHSVEFGWNLNGFGNGCYTVLSMEIIGKPVLIWNAAMPKFNA